MVSASVYWGAAYITVALRARRAAAEDPLPALEPLPTLRDPRADLSVNGSRTSSGHSSFVAVE